MPIAAYLSLMSEGDMSTVIVWFCGAAGAMGGPHSFWRGCVSFRGFSSVCAGVGGAWILIVGAAVWACPVWVVAADGLSLLRLILFASDSRFDLVACSSLLYSSYHWCASGSLSI